MDEDKKPTMAKLIHRIWSRYQKGSLRHGIHPQDGLKGLEASIKASLTTTFDYRAYLKELPKCLNLREERSDLKLMPTADLMRIPRDEAMRLIDHEIHTTLASRMWEQRRVAALLAGTYLDETGPIIKPLRLV